MCWDVAVICPLTESYVNGDATEADAAAEVAASRKEAQYADTDSHSVSRLLWRLGVLTPLRASF